LSDQYEEMKKHLQSTDEDVKTLRTENQDLKDHVRKLEAESGQMQEDINNPEQYGRRECLEFQGLSWEESENTDQMVIGVQHHIYVPSLLFLLMSDIQHICLQTPFTQHHNCYRTHRPFRPRVEIEIIGFWL